MCIHFIGFRKNEEYWSAVKVWGKPDFVHMIHDKRLYGDVCETDTLVLGSKASPKPHPKYSWQDHELF